MATINTEELCNKVDNHEPHTWDCYMGEHGLGMLTFNCPGVDNWQV